MATACSEFVSDTDAGPTSPSLSYDFLCADAAPALPSHPTPHCAENDLPGWLLSTAPSFSPSLTAASADEEWPQHTQVSCGTEQSTLPSPNGRTSPGDGAGDGETRLARQLRHRKVDRRRRERERRGFLQLAELIALNKGDQPEQPSAHSLRLPLDKATLLEAACAQLRVLQETQRLLSTLNCRLGPSVPSSSSALASQHPPVRLQSARRPLLGLTTISALRWARHQPEDDVSGEVTKYLQTTSLSEIIRPVASQLFAVSVAPASSDPHMTRALEAAGVLLRGESTTAEIDLACPTPELGRWADMHGTIWVAVPRTESRNRASDSANRVVSTTCMLMMHDCVFAFEQSCV